MTKGKFTNMLEVRNIIHRLRNGQSNRFIARETGVDRSIVSRIKTLSILHGWLDPALNMPSDEEIAKVWPLKTCASKPHPLDVHHADIKLWKQQGLTAVVIHRLLKDRCACDIQAVRRYLCKHFPKQVEPVMVRSTVPGQDMDIDFGYLGRFMDEEGKLRKAWLFSFRLRHSRRAYREVVLDQTINTFFKGHIHAFEWFGGVPKTIILDNCKAGILQSTIDNEMVRRSYQEMAEHYGFIISPCVPRTPEHKGGVEADVKYTKTSFLPYFLAKQRELKIQHPSLHDLILALKLWENEVADIHIVYGVGDSPLNLFHNEEKTALIPLPHNRWEITTWGQCIVRKDWRIMYDSAYYSVPFPLIGKTVQICATTSFVRIFHDCKEVALHEKATKQWQYKRREQHAPPFHEAVLTCSKAGLLSMAEQVGPHTYEVSNNILSHPTIDKLRPVRHLLNLALKYSKERLEHACRRALYYKLFSYKSVKNILDNGLDKEQPEARTESKVIPMPQYRFVRDPEDYSSSMPEKQSFLQGLEQHHEHSRHGHAMQGVWNGLMADQIVEEEMKRKEEIHRDPHNV